MVEVRHDNIKSSILFAQKIGNRHFDVIELDICGTAGIDPGIFDLGAFHAGCFERYDQCGNSWSTGPSSSYGGGAIVGEDGVGNPLLCTIDDVDVSASLGCCCYSCHVRSSYVQVSILISGHQKE